MTANDNFTVCQKCQLSALADKDELSTDLHVCLEALPSLMATLQSSDSIFLRAHITPGVGVWMVIAQTSGSQMHSLHCQLCSLPTTAVFGEQETGPTFHWLQSSIPHVLLGCGPERFQKSTLGMTELKGKAAPIVVLYRGPFCKAELRNSRA